MANTKWVILLIAFDDEELPPSVFKECIAAHEDEELAAFLRGAELLDVLRDCDETAAEAYRIQVERKCLR